PGTARTVQQGTSQAGNRSNVPGNATRLYAIDEQASDQVGPSVVRGTILIQSSCAHVLFDTGATLSVIASSFTNRLGLIPEDSGTLMQFDTVVGTHTIPKRVCYRCPLILNDRQFEWDLVVLEMSGFDLILGMDWLMANHAVIE
ncbi:retroviral-like aspartic protease family protein, partial [Klebsiella pneumoniae]|uniref:retroviral-like aspartic protease family protein n=1 Tax=Klebsiella pneumoniae TaxID=573 RepID=UPI0019399417